MFFLFSTSFINARFICSYPNSVFFIIPPINKTIGPINLLTCLIPSFTFCNDFSIKVWSPRYIIFRTLPPQGFFLFYFISNTSDLKIIGFISSGVIFIHRYPSTLRFPSAMGINGFHTSQDSMSKRISQIPSGCQSISIDWSIIRFIAF